MGFRRKLLSQTSKKAIGELCEASAEHKLPIAFFEEPCYHHFFRCVMHHKQYLLSIRKPTTALQIVKKIFKNFMLQMYKILRT